MMRESDDKRAMGRARTHSVSMDARERVVVTGAQELLSFNDMEVCVDTPLGVCWPSKGKSSISNG